MAGVLALGLTACGSDAHTLVGAQIEPPPQVGGFALPDVADEGGERAFTADPGDLLLVFFGFTNCPDICPTTMTDVSRARAELGEDASRVEVGMVTVDPDRDTPELLDAYVSSFVDDGRALRTTDPAALRAVADAFGASYQVTTAPDGRVDVAHSGSVYVVDEEGAVVLVWTFGTDPDDMVADLDALLDQT